MKSLLLGLLVASPAVAAWLRRDFASDSAEVRPESIVRVPVEIIAKGSAPQWVYIEVDGHEASRSGASRDPR